ncbi:transposon Ty3-G Gag-Pol polyprotein [Trichonephila clavipes]|nr:transposon Ty3-G Gag-Pol polyprotein [Trichonephila clavipes]
MKRRTESLNVDKNLMMELFLQRLPSSVQTILAVVSDLTLNKTTDIVDRILEVTPSPIETFPAPRTANWSQCSLYQASNKRAASKLSVLTRNPEKLSILTKQVSHASQIPSSNQSPSCHPADRKNPLSSCSTSKFCQDMGLRTVLQSGCPKENAYSTPLSTDTIYHKLLKKFPFITKLLNPNQPVKHNTVHNIITTGHPVVAKPRKLALDRLKISKTEFQNMMHLGHLRPSKN